MSTARHLLVTGQHAVRLRGRHRTLVVPGASQNGPARLEGTVCELLIEAERRGLHTVVLAPRLTDLEAPTALVCRYVATDSEEVGREAAARYGAERVLRVRSADPADVGDWAGGLPRPASQTLRRRIRTTARRIAPARALHAMITGPRRPKRRT